MTLAFRYVMNLNLNYFPQAICWAISCRSVNIKCDWTRRLVKELHRHTRWKSPALIMQISKKSMLTKRTKTSYWAQHNRWVRYWNAIKAIRRVPSIRTYSTSTYRAHRIYRPAPALNPANSSSSWWIIRQRGNAIVCEWYNSLLIITWAVARTEHKAGCHACRVQCNKAAGAKVSVTPRGLLECA